MAGQGVLGILLGGLVAGYVAVVAVLFVAMRQPPLSLRMASARGRSASQ